MIQSDLSETWGKGGRLYIFTVAHVQRKNVYFIFVQPTTVDCLVIHKLSQHNISQHGITFVYAIFDKIKNTQRVAERCIDNNFHNSVKLTDLRK